MAVILNIVTGLLGSGKTCVLRHLLKDEMPGIKPAVVVGEFAEEGVDALLMETDRPVRQLENTGRGDDAKSYLRPIRELINHSDVNRIYLETSGVTEIHKVIQDLLADPEISSNVEFGASVVVVDAGAFEQHTTYFGSQFWAQIAIADVLVVNKTDRVNKEQLEFVKRRLKDRFPKLPLYMTYMGQLTRSAVNSPIKDDFTPKILSAVADGPGAGEFESFVYRSNLTAFNRVVFGHKLLNLPGARIARFKGKLKVYDKTYCVNGFPGQLDWDNIPMKGNTSIVFIGLNLLDQKDEFVRLLDEELQNQQYDPSRKKPPTFKPKMTRPFKK